MNDQIPPSLQRFGDDLQRAARRELTDDSGSMRPGVRRPRVLAGSSLALAGIAAVLVLALSAGGATAPPAFAVTRNADGSVLVNLTNVEAVPAAEHQLAAMGTDEWFEWVIAQGPATHSGPIDCTPAPAGSTPMGKRLSRVTPAGSTSAAGGPHVKLLLGSDGTSTVPTGETGAGPWHLSACYLYSGTFPGTGNTGNTGNG